PRSRLNWNWPILSRLTLIALPMGIVTMLGSLEFNIPRYFLERHVGVVELGVFSALAYVVLGGNALIGALGQSAVARLAREFADRRPDQFRRTLGKLLLVGALLGVLGLAGTGLFGRVLLAII